MSITSKEELKLRLKEEWTRLTPDYLTKIISKMPKCLQLIIKKLSNKVLKLLSFLIIIIIIYRYLYYCILLSVRIFLRYQKLSKILYHKCNYRNKIYISNNYNKFFNLK